MMKVGEISDTKIKQNFELAVRLVKSLPQKGSFQPSYAEASKIYSYFKQAKFGPCNIPKPSFWDYINRAKWDAWAALGSLSCEDAMENYVSEIKVLFVRVKELEEFKEKEHEFADTLIPFCQENNIPLSQAMLNLMKKEQGKDSIGTKGNNMINGSVEGSTLENGNNMLTEDESECFIPVENGHDHSLLVEAALPPLKSVKFNLNDGETEDNDKNIHLVIEQNDFDNSDKTEEEDEDEEIFCDPLDPAEIQEGERSYITESPLMTTDSGVTFNEAVIERPSQKKPPVIESSSSDSLSQEPVLRTLKQPFHRNRSQKQKKSNTKPKFRHHHAARSCKRLEENQSSHHHQNGGSSQNNSTNQHRTNRSNNPQMSSNTSQILHTSQNNSGRSPSDNPNDSTESYVSSTSYTSDTVGLKIVDALERMENNMQDIIDRLDSIEGTIRTVSKPITPWWQQYLPSRSMMVWAIWPVVVNIAFFLYWRRFRRQRIKKC